MTIESFQDTLFEDPIGLRFRQAREKARWSQESAAQQLKLPVAVLDAIEREDWARLGAPIFARSYVGSYARLLGLPETLADDVVRGKPAPQLNTIGGNVLAKPNRSAVNLGYLLMTVLIVSSVVALALYFQSPRRSAAQIPLDGSGAYAGTMPQPPAASDASMQPAGYQPSPASAPAQAATLAPAGAPADPAPLREANVARFTVSSDGKIAGN